MPTVKIHPLAEILSRKLFSIETVPTDEQGRMVNRAIKAAIEYHDNEVADLQQRIDKAVKRLDGVAYEACVEAFEMLTNTKDKEQKMACTCVPCKECNGTGDVWYSFNGEYLGSRRLDDLDDLDMGGCPDCEGEGIIEMCDECRDYRDTKE